MMTIATIAEYPRRSLHLEPELLKYNDFRQTEVRNTYYLQVVTCRPITTPMFRRANLKESSRIPRAARRDTGRRGDLPGRRRKRVRCRRPSCAPPGLPDTCINNHAPRSIRRPARIHWLRSCASKGACLYTGTSPTTTPSTISRAGSIATSSILPTDPLPLNHRRLTSEMVSKTVRKWNSRSCFRARGFTVTCCCANGTTAGVGLTLVPCVARGKHAYRVSNRTGAIIYDQTSLISSRRNPRGTSAMARP